MSEIRQKKFRCKGYREDLKNVGCQGCTVSIPWQDDLTELDGEIKLETPNNCVYFWGKRRPNWEAVQDGI